MVDVAEWNSDSMVDDVEREEAEEEINAVSDSAAFRSQLQRRDSPLNR